MRSMLLAVLLVSTVFLGQPVHAMTLFGAQTIYISDMSNGASWESYGMSAEAAGNGNEAIDAYSNALQNYTIAVLHSSNSSQKTQAAAASNRMAQRIAILSQ